MKKVVCAILCLSIRGGISGCFLAPPTTTASASVSYNSGGPHFVGAESVTTSSGTEVAAPSESASDPATSKRIKGTSDVSENSTFIYSDETSASEGKEKTETTQKTPETSKETNSGTKETQAPQGTTQEGELTFEPEYTEATENTTGATENTTEAPKNATEAPALGGVPANANEAIDLAKYYIKTYAFARASLIKQLEYDGYAHDTAVYAADNCGADWNEQAPPRKNCTESAC